MLLLLLTELLLFLCPVHAFRVRERVALRTPIRLFSDGTNRTSSSKENIGLFAAESKKVDLPLDATLGLVPGLKPSSGSPSSTNLSGLSAEAEVLRLEAERGQLLLDRERILREKQLLVDIDALIVKLLEVVEASSPPQHQGNEVYDALLLSNKRLLRKDLLFRLVELSSAATSVEEKTRFNSLSDDIMAALARLDPSLHASLTAEVEKELTSELDRIKSGLKKKESENVRVYDQVLQQWIQQTMGGGSNASSPLGGLGAGLNLTDLGGRAMIRFPSAVPLILLPFMLRAPEISAADLDALKSKVFGTNDLLNNTVVDYATFLATFRGKPFTTIQDTIAEANRRISSAGLQERVQLLVLPEYRVVSPENALTERFSGTNMEPVFVVISKEAKPKPPQGPEVQYRSRFPSLLIMFFIFFSIT